LHSTQGLRTWTIFCKAGFVCLFGMIEVLRATSAPKREHNNQRERHQGQNYNEAIFHRCILSLTLRSNLGVPTHQQPVKFPKGAIPRLLHCDPNRVTVGLFTKGEAR